MKEEVENVGKKMFLTGQTLAGKRTAEHWGGHIKDDR